MVRPHAQSRRSGCVRATIKLIGWKAVQPKKLLGLAGFFLIVSGVVLIFGHLVWPDRFVLVSNHFHALGMKFKTHEIGFAVVATGALLLILANIGKAPQSN
jgi:hypothetical protein